MTSLAGQRQRGIEGALVSSTTELSEFTIDAPKAYFLAKL